MPTSRSQPETPMPPDQVACLPDAAGIFHTVYARTGVDDLLNHTLPTAGTSGSTKQVWGLLEQDSIYGRLRRLKDSLHDMYNKYISTNRITTHYTLPCHTGHSRPDGDRRQAHAYPRQRLSRISFRHACKAYEDDDHHKFIRFQQQVSNMHSGK